MIALGIEKPGKVVEATVGTNLYNGFTSVTNIVFAFGMFPSPDLLQYTNTHIPSRTRRFLRLHGGAQRRARLPKGPNHASKH